MEQAWRRTKIPRLTLTMGNSGKIYQTVTQVTVAAAESMYRECEDPECKLWCIGYRIMSQTCSNATTTIITYPKLATGVRWINQLFTIGNTGHFQT
jgi:hypothetical protein